MERIKYFIRKNRADWSRGRTYVNDAGEQKEYGFDGIMGSHMEPFTTRNMSQVPIAIKVYNGRENIHYISGRNSDSTYNKFQTVVRVENTYDKKYELLTTIAQAVPNGYVEMIRTELQRIKPGKKWFISKPLSNTTGIDGMFMFEKYNILNGNVIILHP